MKTEDPIRRGLSTFAEATVDERLDNFGGKMLTKERVIEKVKVLPEDILKEVDDFIDFLEIKRKKGASVWDWLSKGIDKIEESDFKDYLDGLTSYEDMLAKGEIIWK